MKVVLNVVFLDKFSMMVVFDKKTPATNVAGVFLNGAPDTIRTCDRCLRRALLYPAELRAQGVY